MKIVVKRISLFCLFSSDYEIPVNCCGNETNSVAFVNCTLVRRFRRFGGSFLARHPGTRKNVGVGPCQVEHEASTSKIGEDQLFYCRQRGISPEDAVTLIVNGFCKQVFRELPMEFAVEAQKLLGVSLEGGVG